MGGFKQPTFELTPEQKEDMRDKGDGPKITEKQEKLSEKREAYASYLASMGDSGHLEYFKHGITDWGYHGEINGHKIKATCKLGGLGLHFFVDGNMVQDEELNKFLVNKYIPDGEQYEKIISIKSSEKLVSGSDIDSANQEIQEHNKKHPNIAQIREAANNLLK